MNRPNPDIDEIYNSRVKCNDMVELNFYPESGSLSELENIEKVQDNNTNSIRRHYTVNRDFRARLKNEIDVNDAAFNYYYKSNELELTAKNNERNSSKICRLDKNYESQTPNINNRYDSINHLKRNNEENKSNNDIHETDRDLLRTLQKVDLIKKRATPYRTTDEEYKDEEEEDAPNSPKASESIGIEHNQCINKNEFSMISTKVNRMMNFMNKKIIRISCSIPNIDRLVSNLHLSEQINLTRSFFAHHNDTGRNEILIQKSGWLEVKWRKSSCFCKRWSKQYCIAKDNAIFVYNSKRKQTVDFVIDFNWMTAAVLVEDRQPRTKFKIKILGMQAPIEFRIPKEFENTSEMHEWIEAVYEHLETSSGYRYDKVILQLIDNNEFKYPRLTNQEFLAMAETGDILLFQGKSKGSALQRFITCSKYDHVAVVLKCMDDKVLIFESTGENGVDILDWKLFIEKGWPHLYHKIVYRKLRGERSNDQLIKFESFILSVKNCKFGLNLKSIIMRKESDETQSQNKTFFCSELAAASYKALGILSDDTVCTRYWPGTFSTEKDITLLNGASLGDEYLLETMI